MMNFKQYLKDLGYSNTTIYTYTNEASSFVSWCSKKNLDPEQIDYKNILGYVKLLQSKRLSKQSVNHKIGSLKLYFNYLVAESYRLDNPIESLVIRGTKKAIKHNLLEQEELEDLYFAFKTDENTVYKALRAKRNKVIVGFMVYQGLNTTDLKNLEVEDVHLYKGRVNVRGTSRSNSRSLELKSWQVIELLEYINEIRPELATSQSSESDKLFIPNNPRLDVTISAINKKLKTYNTRVENLKQIRASVITLWLKQHNLRMVQYMAGHRFISSTEKYLQEDLESLQEIINSRHPLR